MPALKKKDSTRLSFHLEEVLTRVGKEGAICSDKFQDASEKPSVEAGPRVKAGISVK